MHGGETTWIARHRRRQRAAVAHRIAQPGHRRPYTGGRGLLHIAQRPVEVLAGGQHRRQFPDQVGDVLLAQTASAAQVEMQQTRPAGGLVCRFGPNRHGALALQPGDHLRLGRRVHQAGQPFAARCRSRCSGTSSWIGSDAAREFLDRRVTSQRRGEAGVEHRPPCRRQRPRARSCCDRRGRRSAARSQAPSPGTRRLPLVRDIRSGGRPGSRPHGRA